MLCRQCDQPAAIGARGRRKAFCSADCDRKWRSEKYQGNKYAVGHRPVNAFDPGHHPWNKDLKGIHLSPATEFPKGMESDKWLPVGSVTTRVDKEGKPRAFVKVAAPNVWVPRAAFVWLAAGRLIQRGEIIHHKNRDTLDDSFDNLVALTRAEHIEEHRADLQGTKGE